MSSSRDLEASAGRLLCRVCCAPTIVRTISIWEMTTTSDANVSNPSSHLDWLMSNDNDPEPYLDNVPEMNNAFAEFIKPTASFNDEFVNLLQEGGIYSYKPFVETFNMKYDKILGILGATIMSQEHTAMAAMYAINLTQYLKKNPITNSKGILHYDSFKKNHQEAWTSLRKQNRRGIKMGSKDALFLLLEHQIRHKKGLGCNSSPKQRKTQPMSSIAVSKGGSYHTPDDAQERIKRTRPGWHQDKRAW